MASTKSFRIRRAAATIAFVTLGCLASTATIAQAAPEPSPVRATQPKASWPQASCANGTWNNCASSIQNNGNNCDVNVYDFAGYSGASLRITRGTYISNLSGYWITYPFDSWNDDIQSNRWC